MDLSKDSSPFLAISSEELSLPQPAVVDLCKAILNKGAEFRFKASGFSMLPCIRSGDILTVSAFSGIPVKFADIVAFTHPVTEKLIIHRVLYKKKDTYLIKGDNIYIVDGFIPLNNIIGRITKIERGGKEIRLGMGLERAFFGFLSFMRIFTLLSIFLSGVRRIWAQQKII
jgi:signal peptidase I